VSTLVVPEYVSLDGVIQAPGHAGEDPSGGFAHGGWSRPGPGPPSWTATSPAGWPS
jgi:hypothetical protein